MPACDWGKPCKCRECIESHSTKICQKCHLNKTFITIPKDAYEREKGFRRYIKFSNYCKVCYEKKLEKDKMKEQKRKKILAKVYLREKKHINGLNKLNYQPTPINNAVIKWRTQLKILSNSERWIQQDIIGNFKDILKIEKIRNRWYCCENRLNEINFALFYIHLYI